MKIKLTLTPEDAALVHDMFLKDDLDDIGVVGLTVLDDNDTITLEVLKSPHLLVGRGIPKGGGGRRPVRNSPKKVILEVCEDYSHFDDAAFLANLADILLKQVTVKSIGPAGTRKGYTSIEVEMTPVEIMRLLKVYKDGRLDDLNISTIMVAHFFYDNLPLAGGSKDYWIKHYFELLKSGLNNWTWPGRKTTQKKETH